MTDINEVLKERDKTHGEWKTQCATSQFLKSIVFNSSSGLNDSQRESLEMICVKISRILNGNHDEPDHWKDIAGYAMLTHNELVKK